MNDSEKHLEREPEPKIPDKLSEDLNTLFKSDASVPPEVDRAIMDRAAQHLIRRRQKSRVLRWLSSAAAAAAIAVAIIGVTMWPTDDLKSTAYAIGNVPELLRDVKTLHLKGHTWCYGPDPEFPNLVEARLREHLAAKVANLSIANANKYYTRRAKGNKGKG